MNATQASKSDAPKTPHFNKLAIEIGRGLGIDTSQNLLRLYQLKETKDQLKLEGAIERERFRIQSRFCDVAEVLSQLETVPNRPQVVLNGQANSTPSEPQHALVAT